MVEYIKNFFKRKKRTYSVSWKHSFNDEVIIYPTEKGWEIIREKYFENYVSERTTNEGGYKDRLWNIIEDYGEYFYHGSDFVISNFELTEKW